MTTAWDGRMEYDDELHMNGKRAAVLVLLAFLMWTALIVGISLLVC